MLRNHLWAGKRRAKWAEKGGKILFRALHVAWEQGLKASEREGGAAQAE